MGAVTVHALAQKIHKLTADGSSAKAKGDPGYPELRRQLADAYDELAAFSSTTAGKKRQSLVAAPAMASKN